MIVDPAVAPGFLLLLAEFVVLAGVGFVVARVVLRQADDRMALAQGMVVGLALWGVITNFVLYVVPGLAGAAVGWGVVLTLGAVLAWRAPERIRPQPRVAAGFVAWCWRCCGWGWPGGNCSWLPTRRSIWGCRRGSGRAGFPRSFLGSPVCRCVITTALTC